MLDKGKISSYQLGLLLYTLVIATSLLFVPAITYANAKQTGWISVLVPSTFFGFAVVWICFTLAARFPGENVIEFLPKVLGKVMGKLVGLIFIIWFGHANAAIVREFGDFLLTAFLPETPLLFFNIVLVLLAASASRNGLEVICRANEFIMPISLMAIFLIMLFSVPDMNLDRLQPVLEEGFKGIIRGSIAPNGWRGEVVMLLMFIPMLNNLQKGLKSSYYAVVGLGVILSLVTVVDIAVFGALSAHHVFPFLSLTEYISIAGILERLESLVVVIWVAGVTIKVACFYHASVLATASWLELKDYKVIVLPMGIITVVWSITFFESSQELVEYLATVFPPYAYTNELLIPLLILVVAWIRKKGGQTNA